VNSILSVTTPAPDLALLTIEELRAAVGVKDNSKDDALTTLGKRVSGRITAACNIVEGGVIPPTLRLETLTETFLMAHWGAFHHTPINSHYWRNPREQPSALDPMVLSRRPIVSVSSVDESGTMLDPADYQIVPSKGELIRLFNGLPSSWWRGQKITIVYEAGWEAVPENLKRAAEQLARDYWFQQARDPAVRQINVPGVVERQYWVGSPNDPDISQEIMDMLRDYRNVILG
jgi:hypothetical protein